MGLRARTRSAPPTPGKMVAKLCSRCRTRTRGTPDVYAACGIAACEVIPWDARVPTALVRFPWDDERRSAKLARELARFTASPDSVHRCRWGTGRAQKVRDRPRRCGRARSHKAFLARPTMRRFESK